MLAGYSAENERLEKDNEALRGAWQLLELDHRSAVEENDRLQARACVGGAEGGGRVHGVDGVATLAAH